MNKAFETGSTPLHMAINNGHTKIVEYLIDKGVDLNVPNICADGATALHMAVINGNNCYHCVVSVIRFCKFVMVFAGSSF